MSFFCLEGQDSTPSFPANLGQTLVFLTFTWLCMSGRNCYFRKLKRKRDSSGNVEEELSWLYILFWAFWSLHFSHGLPWFCLRELLLSFYTWSDGSRLVAVSTGPGANILPGAFHMLPKHTFVPTLSKSPTSDLRAPGLPQVGGV